MDVCALFSSFPIKYGVSKAAVHHLVPMWLLEDLQAGGGKKNKETALNPETVLQYLVVFFFHFTSMKEKYFDLSFDGAYFSVVITYFCF